MLYLFLALVFSLFVAIFAVQNSLPVVVSFLYWSSQTSLVIVILGSAVLGALIMLSLATLMQVKARWTLQKARQRQGEMEAELKTLKERLEKELAKDVSQNDL
ncbi:MAG TPA: LapA family protein [Selenomonadales bacterium]|nr:LapA family protein [Selenomonadales bacterium]